VPSQDKLVVAAERAFDLKLWGDGGGGTDSLDGVASGQMSVHLPLLSLPAP